MVVICSWASGRNAVDDVIPALGPLFRAPSGFLPTAFPAQRNDGATHSPKVKEGNSEGGVPMVVYAVSPGLWGVHQINQA